MEVILSYSVLLKEGACIPNQEERFPLNTEEEKSIARIRYNELLKAPFVANFKYAIINEPTRRVIQAVYSPFGKEYTFEVDFSVAKHQAVEVEDIYNPGMLTVVVATTKDHEEKVTDIEKQFPIQRLRKAIKFGERKVAPKEDVFLVRRAPYVLSKQEMEDAQKRVNSMQLV